VQITSSQMDAIAEALQGGFVRKLTRYIAQECRFDRPYDGSEGLAGADLESSVRELIGHARSFGIRTELGQGQFVILGVGYSRGFFRDPRVVAMLRAPEWSPEENVQRVLNAVIVAEARRA